MLTAGGTTDLKDTGGTTYLTVQPTNPASWPPLFGVLTQDDISQTPTSTCWWSMRRPAAMAYPFRWWSSSSTSLSLDNVVTGTAASKLVTVTQLRGRAEPQPVGV